MRAAIVTNSEYKQLTDSDALLVKPLADQSVEVSACAWDDESIAWNAFDFILLRSPYSYYKQLERFKNWITALEAQLLVVLNSASTVLSNCDKHYLLDLEKRGTVILPSVFVEQGDDTSLAEILDKMNWGEVVFKPAISGGAYLTHRTTRAQATDHQPFFDEVKKHSAVLIQPFAQEICETGEWSLIFFNGSFSHAINKLPKQGEFRTQPRLGGVVSATTPPSAILRDSQTLVESLTEVPLYARVDSILRDGRMALMELELIEPALFFEADVDSPKRMVDAILNKLKK